MADLVRSPGEATPCSYTIEEQTAGDGYCWRYRRYRLSGLPKARVVCLHGIQSHGGWYAYSCTRLSQAGFEVSFLDRRGAGLNEQNRGDAPSFRRLLDDIAEFLCLLSSGRKKRRERENNGADSKKRPVAPSAAVSFSPSLFPCATVAVPVFLLAISWGGKLAVALQRRHPGLVDGLALLCPGFFPRVRPTMKQHFGIVWSRLVNPGQLFPIPLNHPDLFTATPHWQQFIAKDPLGLRQATARLLLESMRLDGYLHFVPSYVRMPVLLLLAEKDRIIDNARTRHYVQRFASAEQQVIEYPGAQHTLEFEPAPDLFINDLINWLERRSKSYRGSE